MRLYPSALIYGRLRSVPLAAILARIMLSVLPLAIFAVETPARAQRVHLFPKVRAGQVLTYDVTYQSDKQVKTHSSFITAAPANSEKVDVRTIVRVEILDVQSQRGSGAIHARTRFEPVNPDAPSEAAGADSPQPQRDPSDDKSVEFTLLPGGEVRDVKGLETLTPEQQQAWQEWVSRFALATVFPASGVKIAQKWKSDEPETSPSPIAGLRWMRESTYVADEPCSPVNLSVQGELVPSDAPPDTCAVILTTATLKQQSSPTNSTPEAFQVHELRTTGSAHGKNRIITYISLKTGLIVRATEEANQNMDVTVAKADRSNRVHYNVAAKSHSEVLLVSGTPLSHADSH